MFSLLKWACGCVILCLPFSYALHLGFLEKSNMEVAVPVSFSKIETRVSEIAEKVQRRFAAQAPHPRAMGSSFLASDPAHLPVRDRFIMEHFQPDNAGNYFCNLMVNDLPRRCEIRGLKLRGPSFREVDETAKTVGISGCLEYSYSAEAHRFAGLNSWQDGLPPNMHTLSFIRQNNNWIIESDKLNLLKWATPD
ncbi:MAG: hypothetical protein P1U68_11955 [Verrucomicrobiales bacterium]|nr:hypothetical protein [Verrucomicrobiales bacterium]